MEHLDMQTPDGNQLNLDALYKICPSCFTESKDKEGKLKRVVDWAKLRALLGDNAVEDAPEVYDFTWVGKRAAQREAAKPINKTLRPCPEESVDWDTTQNLYIEGDNLEVLKLLQNSYMGKVKMIYIDPPYNTGNDFVYHDDFAQSAEEYDEHNVDEDGNRFRKNTDSNGRFHSDWCSMMYSRLMVARSLLREDGVIFISIDENEVENAKRICDEVYGEINFVGNISWQRTYSTRNDAKGIVSEVEYILVYSKTPSWQPNKFPRTDEMNSKYKNPDNDYAPWRSDNAYAADAATHQGMVYAIQHPFTGEFLYPSNGSHWRYKQEEMFRIMNEWTPYVLKDIHDDEKRAVICGTSTDSVRKNVKSIILADPLGIAKQNAQKVLEKGPWPRFFFSKNGTGSIARKTYLDKVEGVPPTNFFSHKDAGHTDEAKKDLMVLFDGEPVFDTPKPSRLIERLLHIASNKDSIIIDFFSGSGVSAQAVMNTNSKDSGQRKYILVQIPEATDHPKYSTICEIGKERIRRAGKKIKEEHPEAKDLDVGFRVLKCDESNMKDVYFSPKELQQGMLDFMEDNIKEDRSDLDLLFDCMLRWGVELSLPMTTTQVDGCTIHNVNDGDLLACFAGTITDKVVSSIAAQHPHRVVFRDSSFTDASQKMNLFEQFKQLLTWSDQEVRNNVKVI